MPLVIHLMLMGVPSPVIWQDGGDPKHLNDLAPRSSPYLLRPTTINSRREIYGFGVAPDRDVHGLVAIPRDSASGHAQSGDDGEDRRPVLAEHVRKLMRERFRSRRP
jgi:hypothetical protein